MFENDLDIKHITGYALIELTRNNSDNQHYLSFEVNHNVFFNKEKFVLIINNKTEFNKLMDNRLVILDQIIFESRYLFVQQMFSYMFEFLELSEIYTEITKLYIPDLFSFYENSFEIFMSKLYASVSDHETEKLKILNKLKLLHTDG